MCQSLVFCLLKRILFSFNYLPFMFQDTKVELESGEGTYFPALNVGSDKPSAVVYLTLFPVNVIGLLNLLQSL